MNDDTLHKIFSSHYPDVLGFIGIEEQISAFVHSREGDARKRECERIKEIIRTKRDGHQEWRDANSVGLDEKKEHALAVFILDRVLAQIEGGKT